jgi:hypothetical protein
MGNIQHSTFNPERRNFFEARLSGLWVLNVLLLLLLLAPVPLPAQTQPSIPPATAAQLVMRPQPPVDNSQFKNVTATAEFDPPVVRPGEKTFYRVAVTAMGDSVEWPDQITAPAALTFGRSAHGQLTQSDGTQFHPLTEFIYEVIPTAAGHFAISNFSIFANGRSVEIPAANLDVVAGNAPLAPGPRQLVLEAAATNVFLGEPFRVSVMLPSGPGNQIEALREIQLNGNGLMTDKTAMQQSVKEIKINGESRPAFICDMVVTPITPGPLKISAQGFTAGREFSGPITIQGQVVIPGGVPQYVLLISDPVDINVRPLPSGSELPGFTGAIGKFLRDPPQLSTNRLRVGEPAHLKLVFRPVGGLTRLVPPEPPRSPDWQVIPDNPPDIGYTLIPLTDEARGTPPIPFCSFDPATAKYVDLTIPSLPVTVVGDSLPVQLPAFDNETASATPLKLSKLAPTPGKTIGSLEPLQLRGWFVCVQLAPVAGLLALWQWDRRRRFLEAHPEIARRRQARRALRREKGRLQKAIAAGDETAFVEHAANAMKISCAPHLPAHPQALVCADVLAQLDGAEQTGRAGETVRKIFASADAQFATTAQIQTGCLALRSDVAAVLEKLEAKL